MNVRSVVKRWFEEQLNFTLSDGSEAETVFIGTAEFSPIEILSEFDATYEQVFNDWLFGDWKLRQHDLRETLLNYSANGDRYSDLQNAVIRQQVVPFVGSGMSVPSGLPTWAEFLMSMQVYAQCSRSELQELIKDSLFEEAADLLADSMNSRLIAERIEHDLRIPNPDTINGSICLLPGLFPNLVITTNLDRILEELYKFCGMPFEFVLWGDHFADYRSFKDPSGRFLLKLHGDNQDQKGRILFSEEYKGAYATGSPLREELSLLYRQNNLLFPGCSLGADRTLNLLEYVAKLDVNMPKHYALLPKPQNQQKEFTREHFLTERGIYPIWYELPHDESIMALLDGLNMDEVV